jgi:hypothetical protein
MELWFSDFFCDNGSPDGRDVQAGLTDRMIYQRHVGGFLAFQFHSLSEHVLTESEESVLKRGLNFASTNLDMVCVAESARFKLHPALEFCWRI